MCHKGVIETTRQHYSKKYQVSAEHESVKKDRQSQLPMTHSCDSSDINHSHLVRRKSDDVTLSKIVYLNPSENL